VGEQKLKEVIKEMREFYNVICLPEKLPLLSGMVKNWIGALEQLEREQIKEDVKN
jgi:hypothetical protein